MRKIILFFVVTIFLSFVIPNLFLIGTFNTSLKNNNLIDSGDKDFDASKIRLLLTEENKIVELDLDDYIKGVLIGEVPVTYELEALKAQAIVARTYTLYKLKNAKASHENADMCDDINCCQCYKTKEYAFASWDDAEEEAKWTKIERAVEETKDKYITYDGEIISAFFHAHSGGKTEDVVNVWGGNEIPYLKSVDGNEADMRADTKIFANSEFKELLKSSNINIDENDYSVEILDYTGSGRVNTLKINDTIVKATELRKITGIRSTNFRIEKDETNITFYTVGYGHGVGMSQEGANQMAKDGSNCEEIIKHYYTGVEIESAVTYN